MCLCSFQIQSNYLSIKQCQLCKLQPREVCKGHQVIYPYQPKVILGILQVRKASLHAVQHSNYLNICVSVSSHHIQQVQYRQQIVGLVYQTCDTTTEN